MLKVKRIADGVIFGFNGFDKPPATRDGFVVFDDAVEGAEPETLNVSTVEDKKETDFPKAVNPMETTPEVSEVKLATDKAGPVVENIEDAGNPEDTIPTPPDGEMERLKGMTRKKIGMYMESVYGETIPNLNRKKVEILADAESIIENRKGL